MLIWSVFMDISDTSLNSLDCYWFFLHSKYPNLGTPNPHASMIASAQVPVVFPQVMPHQAPTQQEETASPQQQHQLSPAINGVAGAQQQQPQQLPPVFNLNSMFGGFAGAPNFAAFMAAPQQAQAAWLANPALFQQQLFMNQLAQHQAAQQQHQQQHQQGSNLQQLQQDASFGGPTTQLPTVKTEPQAHMSRTNADENAMKSNGNHPHLTQTSSRCAEV